MSSSDMSEMGMKEKLNHDSPFISHNKFAPLQNTEEMAMNVSASPDETNSTKRDKLLHCM